MHAEPEWGPLSVGIKKYFLNVPIQKPIKRLAIVSNEPAIVSYWVYYMSVDGFINSKLQFPYWISNKIIIYQSNMY